MRPRWISDDPSPNPPRIGTTVIASWLPGGYVLVSTICVDGNSALARLRSSIQTGVPYDDAPPLPESFVTQVVRCDQYGVARSWDNPFFEKEYATHQEVRTGHREAVAKFSQ
jgi:hypothetical protein